MTEDQLLRLCDEWFRLQDEMLRLPAGEVELVCTSLIVTSARNPGLQAGEG